MKLLGGAIMPNAERCALQRVLYACFVDDPFRANMRIGAARFAAQRPRRTDGKRVWFRDVASWVDTRGVAHEHVSFISLDPGGYRHTPPSDPAEVVENLGSVPMEFGIFDDLRDLVSQASSYPLAGEESKHWIDVATSVLDGTIANTFGPNRQRFRNFAERLRTGELREFGPVVKTVYEDIFFPLGLPNTEFSDAYLLLQVQAVTNLWVQQNLFTHPSDGLNKFLHELRKSGLPDSSSDFRAYASGLFQDASKLLKDALASWSIIEFQRRLYQATHYFWCAFRLAAQSPAFLGYPPLVAEESFCCCVAGLTIGSHFYWQDPRATAHEMLPEISDDVAQSEYRLVQRYSSPRNPTMPRFLFDLFFAYALVLKSAATASEGWDRLQRIAQRAGPTDLGDDLPDDWIDLIALNAARHLGDQAATQKHAVRLASRLVMAKAFLK